MKFSTKLFFTFLSALLGVFSFFRFLFLFIYSDSFSDIGIRLILFAFIDGIRFDLSILLTISGLPLFLMNLPVEKKWWFKLWSIFLIPGIFVQIIILVADFIYFGDVKRHLGDELLLIFNDFNFISDLISTGYLFMLVIVLLIIGLIIYISFRTIDRKYYKSKILLKFEIPKQILIIILFVLGVRGTVGLKPINVIDAYRKGSSEYGNLVLNGVFSALHISMYSENISHNFFEKGEALKFTTDFVMEKDEFYVDNRYPLTRKRTNYFYGNPGTKKKFNIVLLILESWSSQYIDYLSHKGYGVTPNFDSLASKGIIFNNFYANAQRSLFSFTSIFLSTPPFQGTPYLGSGLELSNTFRVGKDFKKYGYNTIFIQTARRRSLWVDAIARNLGFDKYYGMEDIPRIYPYITNKSPSFGWDYDAFMFLEEKLEKIGNPFFAFLFTGTTHEPYLLPDKRFEKYPHDTYGLNGFLNTLYYSDWSIGEFFKRISKKEWFNNTIFVFTADHALDKFQNPSVENLFKIPLLIYCPSTLSPNECNFLGSQVDILPTIIDLSGFEFNYSGIGKSLLRDYQKRAAIFLDGTNMGIITELGYLKHSGTKRLEYCISDSTKQEEKLFYMEKLLLSVNQTLYILFKENRFFKN